ncbi:hypothetical protein PSDVSF_13470 [Pseudodesulfovibrio sediminis]|uniref:Uncharacterized protein n=1 Tax=Pseudodesulfovibrio sediminis TaxID=2810563 RepID=A0ABN6ES97_9BACT|nr:hypothetical protein PSDVSF_13470 [Pseudodesulfovibrio sediminis]
MKKVRQDVYLSLEEERTSQQLHTSASGQGGYCFPSAVCWSVMRSNSDWVICHDLIFV